MVSTSTLLGCTNGTPYTTHIMQFNSVARYGIGENCSTALFFTIVVYVGLFTHPVFTSDLLITRTAKHNVQIELSLYGFVYCICIFIPNFLLFNYVLTVSMGKRLLDACKTLWNQYFKNQFRYYMQATRNKEPNGCVIYKIRIWYSLHRWQEQAKRDHISWKKIKKNKQLNFQI
jgi:hypothetical protein